MDNPVVVEVSDGGEGGTDELSGVKFEVASLTANAVEEFSTEGKIGYKVY